MGRFKGMHKGQNGNRINDVRTEKDRSKGRA
ncbi:hypothetical protein OKW35_003558 [Paraburkholderia sp. MM5477-R1]